MSGQSESSSTEVDWCEADRPYPNLEESHPLLLAINRQLSLNKIAHMLILNYFKVNNYKPIVLCNGMLNPLVDAEAVHLLLLLVLLL